VFLFRNSPDQIEGEQRIIYKFDMLDPKSYLLAQNMQIKDKDLIYVANAKANAPLKLIGTINQLITPVVTAKAIGLF
jgi:polysaccharide biosynthesis/export protein